MTGPLIATIQSRSIPLDQGLINPMCWKGDLFRIYHLETISTHQHPSAEVNSFKSQWHTEVITRLLQSGHARRSALVEQPGMSSYDKERLEMEILDIKNYIQKANDPDNAITKERESAVTRIVARKAMLFGKEDTWMPKWHQKGINGDGHA